MIQRQGLGVVGGTASSSCGFGPRGYLDASFSTCKAAQHSTLSLSMLDERRRRLTGGQRNDGRVRVH